MAHLKIENTDIAGVKRISKHKLGDSRGHFSRMFCREELAQAGFAIDVQQINHTYSSKAGTLRGMHFQYEPAAEIKIVSCLRGVVFDVALDLREGSQTFGQWTAETLSQENWTSLLIPPGVAHGFQALSDDVELLYFHSAPYRPDLEAGVNPLDEEVNIAWPQPITEMSQRDQNLPLLRKLAAPVTLTADTVDNN